MVEVCKQVYNPGCWLKPLHQESLVGDKVDGFWGESSGLEDLEAGKKERKQSVDTPIGLNSLSKTFNIIRIVGQGQDHHV